MIKNEAQHVKVKGDSCIMFELVKQSLFLCVNGSTLFPLAQLYKHVHIPSLELKKNKSDCRFGCLLLSNSPCTFLFSYHVSHHIHATEVSVIDTPNESDVYTSICATVVCMTENLICNI